MASILVCYGTGEGQTEKVADRLADELGMRGHGPTTVNVKAIGDDIDVADFDAVLVDASIHFGRHQKAVRTFVTAKRDVLVTKPISDDDRSRVRLFGRISRRPDPSHRYHRGQKQYRRTDDEPGPRR